MKDMHDEDESDDDSDYSDEFDEEEEEEEEEAKELFWNRVFKESLVLTSCLEFQARITLDPLLLTQEQYYYICGNFLSKDILKVVDTVLQNPSSYPLIDLTAGALNGDSDAYPAQFSLIFGVYESSTERVNNYYSFLGLIRRLVIIMQFEWLLIVDA